MPGFEIIPYNDLPALEVFRSFFLCNNSFTCLLSEVVNIDIKKVNLVYLPMDKCCGCKINCTFCLVFEVLTSAH